MIRRWLVGFAMALALGSAVGLTLLDLIDHPHDWWAVVTFLSGTLVGWAWDHHGGGKTPRP